MNKPDFFKGRPIIQPGETYEIDGIPHKVITATTAIVGENMNGLKMTTPVYWLDNLKTNQRIFISEKELEAKFS